MPTRMASQTIVARTHTTLDRQFLMAALLANTLFGNVVIGSSDPTGTSPSNNRAASVGRALHLTLRARPEPMRKVILAAEGNVVSMILRIILSLLFEHGKNIIGPQFGWLPSS